MIVHTLRELWNGTYSILVSINKCTHILINNLCRCILSVSSQHYWEKRSMTRILIISINQKARNYYWWNHMCMKAFPSLLCISKHLSLGWRIPSSDINDTVKQWCITTTYKCICKTSSLWTNMSSLFPFRVAFIYSTFFTCAITCIIVGLETTLLVLHTSTHNFIVYTLSL